MDVLNAGLRGPFAKPMRSPFAPGARTPTQRAIAVLRKFGTDAHVYLPGVGMLNGLQAGNYLDSAGTTQGTVDQPVGLVLDAAGGVGPNLFPSGTFGNGIASANYVARGTKELASGSLRITTTELTTNFGVVTAIALGTIVNNALITIKVKSVSKVSSTHTIGFYLSAGQNSGVSTTGVSTNGAGEYRFFVPSTTLTYITARSEFGVATIGDTWDIESVSVREVTGIHAQQPTTSAKPILRRDAGGRYYWQFDGSNDSLSLGGPLFQMADDHCVIAGGLSTLATGDRYFLDHGSSASASPMVASLALAGTLAKVYWRDDANVTTAINGGFVAQGSVAILSARKVSTTGVLRVNGQQVASAAIAAGATTCTGAAIGTRVSPANMLAGQVYPVIAIKGTVSDSDLLLLEKWLGSMSGVTI